MSNNLKVNAKTKPLELKKKHNLLVKKVEDVETEIPSETAITNLAKAAIQADKDILSQIVYDEDEDILYFPEGIIPLKIYSDSYDGGTFLFFDYANECLRDEVNDGIPGMTLDINHNKLEIDDPNGNLNISEIVYINGKGVANVDNSLNFNSYYIFNPVISGGTKLYKHNFTVVDDEGDTYDIELISTNSTPLTKATLSNNFLSAYCVSSDYSVMVGNKVLGLAPDELNGLVSASGAYNAITIMSMQGTDTVTEL